MNELMSKADAMKLDPVSRRNFMHMAARAAYGVSVLPLVGGASSALAQTAAGGKAKNLIYLYMSGGMTHMDTFDLKPGAATQGPTEAVKSVSGVRLGSQLIKLARQMNHVAVINSLHSTTGAHAQGNYLMHTSYPMRGTIKHPSMGAWLLNLSKWDETRTNPLPGSVLVGGGSSAASPGFMASKFAPLPLPGPASGVPNSKSYFSKDEFEKHLRVADAFDRTFRRRHYGKKVEDEGFEGGYKSIRSYNRLYEDAIKLMNSKELEVFDISKEPASERERYGNHYFGQGCLLARRLVQNGVRYVEVNLGGWDTHNDNFNAMDGKLPPLDDGLGTLLEDLSSLGLLDETIVVLATEFGRSPRINPSQGRDHHPGAFSGLMAGAGINGGQAYGATDASGHRVAKDPVSIQNFNATIAAALGLPQDEVIKSPSGRPFTVADKGKPIAGLLA